MSIYVYVTKACHEDARKHNLQDDLNNLEKKVEKNQSTENFSSLQNSPFFKKPFGKAFRLYTCEKEVDEDIVICFLRIVHKGNKDNKQWVWDGEFRKEKLQEITNENEIREFLRERNQRNPLPPPPRPTEMERIWLNEVFLPDEVGHEDIIILETEQWVDQTRTDAFQYALANICKLLSDLSDVKNLNKQSNTKINLFWDDNLSIGFLYRYFPILHRLLLIKLINSKLTMSEIASLDELDEDHITIALLDDNKDKLIDLLKHAYRSYPWYIVAEFQAWLAIQKNQESNLALSPEESGILSSIKNPQEGQPVFPLFINGRAGSGKSTLLHYFMKDCIEFTQRHGENLFPCYLTCSEKLLENAKTNIRQLVKTHHSSVVKGLQEDRLDDIFESSFHIFHRFVLSKLPEELRESKFQPTKYVNRRRFKDRWNIFFKQRDRRFKKEFNPDISWYVIRTYIKGMANGPGEYFTLDDYKELPRDQKTVTDKIFGGIFDNIWVGWYKAECEEGLWDDQDIVLEALQQENFHSDYPVVICDEAQDFTQVEIEFIYHLSLFSKRSLFSHELRMVPFIFAGDPLQTLNPTGFRWESLRALFHSNIIQILARSNRASLDFNYKDLSINYRSSENIVRFCNLILLVRSQLFDIKNVCSQQPWRTVGEKEIPVFFFDVNDNRTQDLLRALDVVKIIDCEDGDEGDIVKDDDVLSRLVQFDEIGIPMNVLSPAKAKGLEYNRVALYGFGNSGQKNTELMDYIYRSEDREYNPDHHLPFEYFFNRLYVGTSRPKKQLYIIDSQEAFNNFWRFARDTETLNNIARKIIESHPDRWDDSKLFYLQNGTGLNLNFESFNPEELARSYKDQGLQELSSQLLRQARHVYSNINRESDAIECHAHALRFEQNHLEAGKNFDKIGHYNEAIDCYWAGEYFKEVIRVAEANPDCSTMKVRASIFHINTLDNNDVIDFLKSFVDYMATENERQRVLLDHTWIRVIGNIPQRIERITPDSFSVERWRYVFRLLDQLNHWGFVINEGVLAEIAYRAKDYMRAIRLWEKEGKESASESYKIAKAETEAFPNNMPWLSQLGRKKDIIDQWIKNSRPIADLNSTIINQIFEALCLDGEKLADAIDVLKARPLDIELKDIINSTLSDKAVNAVIIEDVFQIYIASLLKQELLDEALAFRDSNKLESYAPKGAIKNAVTDWKAFKTRVNSTIVTGLAFSQKLPQSDSQKQFSDYLRSLFSPDPTQKVLDWKNYSKYVTCDVAGAAIERANRIVDALSFYEWLRHNGDDKQKDFAQTRLVKCMKRRADFFAADNRPEESRRVNFELQENIKNWQTKKPDEIEAYPVIDDKIFEKYLKVPLRNKTKDRAPDISLESKSQLQQESSALERESSTVGLKIDRPLEQIHEVKYFRFSINNISIELKPTEVRLDNTEQYSYAVYDMKEHTVKGGGKFILGENDIWKSREWNISVNFIENERRLERIELMYKRNKINIAFY